MSSNSSVTKVENLEYTDRLNYLRDKNNLLDEIVDEAMDEILNFMTADDTRLVEGFLGFGKIENDSFYKSKIK